MNTKKIIILTILLSIIVIFAPVNGYALTCKSLLGSPNNENSLAWLIQEAFSILKYAGPFILLVFSSIDFVKVIAQGDDESMSKAQKKLIFRIIGVVLLFFVPNLVWLIMELFGVVSSPTCGIK